MMKDVFFYEAFAEERSALERHLPSGIRAAFCPLTIQETADEAPPAGIISIRTQSAIPRGWLRNLRGILTRSTGYDHLERLCARMETELPLGYLPLYCSRAVAEQAALMWMALLRRLPRQVLSFDTFSRDGLTGAECARRTLLVVGVGNIGSEVARIGEGLDMQVFGVDIAPGRSDIPYVAIEEGLRRAHVIVCAMNLTPENRGYFDYQRLKKAREGAIFVNIARGELSPADDLLRLLTEGHLGGVALDVYEHEDLLGACLRSQGECSDVVLAATLKLAGQDNVILTPHNAFNTAEAVEKKARQSIRQIESLLTRGEFLWPLPRRSVT